MIIRNDHAILFSDNIPSPLAHRPERGNLRSDEDTAKELRAEDGNLLMAELCFYREFLLLNACDSCSHRSRYL